jgi:PAS domain S-box-containing protein
MTSQKNRPWSTALSVRDIARMGGVCGLYIATALGGLSLDAVSGVAAAVWPPTGIALAALLLYGACLWPGIAMGAFLVNLFVGAPVLVAGGMALGNTLEAVLGTVLLTRVVGFRPSLARLQDVLGLVVLAAGGSTLVSATIGVTSGWLGGVIPAATYGEAWRTWWLGDALGDLVVAPLLCVWSGRGRVALSRRWIAEALVLLGAVGALSLTVFDLGAPAWLVPPYLVFPVLIGVALRLGPPGAVTALALVSTGVLWGTIQGGGPFTGPTLHGRLFAVQAFMSVVTVTILLLAAVLAERRQKEAEAHEQRERLHVTLASIGDAVLATDSQGRVTLLNAAAAALTGWPAAEALGKDITEVFPIVNEYSRQAVENPVVKTLRAGTVVGLANQTLLRARDGVERPIDDSGAPIRDRQGRLVGAVLVFRDITERRQAEDAQRRLAALVTSSEDAIIGKTLDGIITSWNQGAERLYGYPAAEMVGQSIAHLIPPDLPDDLPAILARLRRGERIQQYETQRVAKDGTRLDVALTISSIRDGTGKILGASTIARDITACKHAEAAQHVLAEVSALLATTHDLRTQTEQLARLLVPTLADWCSIDLLQDDGRIRRLAVVHADPTKAALAEQLRRHYPLLPADASHTLARVLQTRQSWFDPAVSAERLRAEARDAAHWELEQALGFQAEMVVPLVARGWVLGTLTCVLGAGPRRYSTADLALVEELARRAAVAIDNARLYQIAETAHTALQQTNADLERRVQERTALLRLLYDLAVVANKASTSEEAIQQALDRICAATGWPVGHAYLPAPDASGAWVPTSLWHLRDPARFAAWQEVTLTTRIAPGEGLIGRVGVSGQAEWSAEVTTDPALRYRPAAATVPLTAGYAVPLLMQQEVVGVLAFYTDTRGTPDAALLDTLGQVGMHLGRVIERQRATERAQHQHDALVQREKLAAMSALLASVAHELNNPLASIVLHAELLGDEVQGGVLAPPVAEIAQAAARCERLVRQFLTLARPHPPERVAVALNTLVAETVELLAYAFQVDNVVVHLHLDDQVPPLWGDPHQVQQVLLNLLTNAQQALRTAPGVREVILTTQYDSAQDRITLTVADTGPGVSPELQARIFEPFFTTKPPGVGTGLGLPLCREIIEAHGGTLDVTSAPGHGATFRITLPVEAVPALPPALPPATEKPAVRSLRILIVDDEPSIATGLVRLLRRDGHTVDTATNGRLALAQLAERAYDLILSDVRMPDLDGPSLYRLLERQQPHLCQRFIFLTGDTLEPATQIFLAASGVPCLTKPLRSAEVRRAIQEFQGQVPDH